MDNAELSESIKIMCETILKDYNSMKLVTDEALKSSNDIIQEIKDNKIACHSNIDAVKEINRLIGSIHMYEWLLVKRIEVIEDLIRYV